MNWSFPERRLKSGEEEHFRQRKELTQGMGRRGMFGYK